MRLRVGIVGLGPAWDKRHLPALRALADRYEVRGVCEQVSHLAHRAAGELGAAPADGFRKLAARDDIDAIRNAYRIIYKSGLTLDEAKAALANEEQTQPAVSAHLKTMREFLESVTRGIVR